MTFAELKMKSLNESGVLRVPNVDWLRFAGSSLEQAEQVAVGMLRKVKERVDVGLVDLDDQVRVDQVVDAYWPVLESQDQVVVGQDEERASNHRWCRERFDLFSVSKVPDLNCASVNLVNVVSSNQAWHFFSL